MRLSLYRLWIWPRIWGAQWREHDCDALVRVHVESTLAARLPAVQSLRWQGLIDMAGQEQQLTWPCRQSEVVRQLFQHGCVQKVAAVANQGSQGGCGDEAAPASGVQVNCGRCTPYHTLPRAAIPASGVGQGPPNQAHPGFPIQQPGKRQLWWQPAKSPSIGCRRPGRPHQKPLSTPPTRL
jgi:hypothetical protein